MDIKFLSMNAKFSLAAIVVLILRLVFEYYGWQDLYTWSNITATILFVSGGICVSVGLCKHSFERMIETTKEFVLRFRRS